MNGLFDLVGMRPPPPEPPARPEKPGRDLPVLSLVLLALLVLGCLVFPLFLSKSPVYMDLSHPNTAPCGAFWFGTDAMGRDIFSMVWHGGRLSLCIGAGAAALSAVFAIVFGAASGCAPGWLDALLMRLTEILLSVPSLLLIVLLQAALGEATVLSLSLVIGATGWTSIAKVVRTQVRQLRASEYILAARTMGGGFFHILWRHLTPNLLPSILFMVVMNIRGAIAAESTLSFMGIGLPLEVITWGSMLSLAENALLPGAWWIIVIPGAFLAGTLLCMTELGNYLQKTINRKESNL